MGLSSSQARLLNLTARMHQIEYKAARLEAMKLQMANESKRVYEDYLDALDKTKIQLKTLNTDGSVTYKDMFSYADFTNAGYAIDFQGVVYDGKVVTKADGSECNRHVITDTEYSTNKNALDMAGYKAGDVVYYTGTTFNPANIKSASEVVDGSIEQLILNAYGGKTAPTGTAFETVITNLINSGMVTIVTKRDSGEFAKESDFDFADYETSVSTNTGLQEVTDEVNLKKAEAKYEADMKRIDLKDRKYDSDLAAMDAERNAIKQEMETLKTVAKDNVERTFKLFS